MSQHDGIQQLDQSNVGQLFKKIPIWGSNSHSSLGQNYATFCLIICSLRTSFKCCSMKEHSRYTIVTVNYAKKSLLWQIGYLGPNLGQNYASLYLFERLQDDGACFLDISHDSQFLQKNLILEEMSNFDPNLPRFLQPSIL